MYSDKDILEAWRLWYKKLETEEDDGTDYSDYTADDQSIWFIELLKQVQTTN